MSECALYQDESCGSVSLFTGRREPDTKERMQGILARQSVLNDSNVTLTFIFKTWRRRGVSRDKVKALRIGGRTYRGM